MSATMGPMTSTKITGTREQWQRVARAVRAARLEQRKSQADYGRFGLSQTTLNKIEKVRQLSFNEATIYGIEDAFAWKRGHVQELLDGDAVRTIEGEGFTVVVRDPTQTDEQIAEAIQQTVMKRPKDG